MKVTAYDRKCTFHVICIVFFKKISKISIKGDRIYNAVNFNFNFVHGIEATSLRVRIDKILNFKE